jgi:glycosyltransferase involved in cell wall biosynthesis
MKVLMISPQPFFEPRGTPISVLQRLMALSSLGHQVDLVTYPLGEHVAINNVQIYRVPRMLPIKEVQIGPSWTKLFLDLSVLLQALFLLLRTRYDVIHSHEEAAFFSTILAAIFRTHHLYDMHSSLPRQMANSRFGRWRVLVFLFDLLERRVLRSCDSVITIDAELEAHVRKLNPSARLLTIENIAIPGEPKAADVHLINQLKSNVKLNSKAAVVYTGTLEHYQGLNLLLDSARLVKEAWRNVVFVLVGGKPHQIAHWQRVAEAKGIADCIVFVGTVTLAEAIDYLSIADVLVSSRTAVTSVPLKIYSYMHSGKPIVATRSPAHTLVLSDDTALLVEPNSQAMAGAVLRLLADPELRHCLGSRAQAYARANYSFKSYAAKVALIYEHTVTAQPLPATFPDTVLSQE